VSRRGRTPKINRILERPAHLSDSEFVTIDKRLLLLISSRKLAN
jgi:hypothetical protein